jgi:hypothetical protein
VVVLVVVSWRLTSERNATNERTSQYLSAVARALATLDNMTREGASPPADDELGARQRKSSYALLCAAC